MNQTAEPSLLVISAIAPNRPGFVKEITDMITQCQCNIIESKMKSMGNKFSLVLMASGEWNAIAKLEHSLPSQAHAMGMTTMIQRTTAKTHHGQHLPYRVKMTTIDRIGLSNGITAFFAEKEINIEELSCNTFDAKQIGDKLVLIKLTINIPTKINIEKLKDEFNSFCHKENIDASLRPVDY
ncbi:MAG: hypothetical protein COA86_02190 [Kangiella sp.]|nr:MAG: hypothetical protein COA86_02190 [Kangiella sp.]